MRQVPQREHFAIFAGVVIIVFLLWLLLILFQTSDLFTNPEVPLWMTASAIAESNATVQEQIDGTQTAQTMTPP